MATQEARTWTYTGGYPDTLKQSTVRVPIATSFKNDGETPHMLLKIHACALNPVDIQMMNLPSWKQPSNDLYEKDKGTACDFSGVVLAGGKSGFSEGDEVLGVTLKPYASDHAGALGEIADINMAATVAVKKPKEWSHEKAAAISLVWLTAKTCIESVAPYVDGSKSKKVAILGGSSATGIYNIILAKRKGWTVATTSSSRNKDFVTSTLKADVHVDYTAQSSRDALIQFAPDAVIDCVGGTDCVGLPSSKRYTTIVGDKTGRTSMGGPYTYYDYREAPFRAAMQWLRWTKGYLGLGESYDVVRLAFNKDWLEESKTILKPEDIYVDSTFAFEEAKAAFERLNSGRARGKVVVRVVK